MGHGPDFFLFTFSVDVDVDVNVDVNVYLVLRGAGGVPRVSKPRVKIHKEIDTKSPYKKGSYRKKISVVPIKKQNCAHFGR